MDLPQLPSPKGQDPGKESAGSESTGQQRDSRPNGTEGTRIPDTDQILAMLMKLSGMVTLVLQDTEIPIRTVAAELGIRRRATARKLRTRIRAALHSPDRSVLAGLDAVLDKRNRLHQAPPEAAYLQNELGGPKSHSNSEVQARQDDNATRTDSMISR
jgi:hypothetical protein